MRIKHKDLKSLEETFCFCGDGLVDDIAKLERATINCGESSDFQSNINNISWWFNYILTEVRNEFQV